MSALLDRFVNRFPDVRPTVTLTDAHVDLTSEDIDVAFLTDGMPVTGAHALHTLAAYESVRVAAPTYVDAHGGAAASGDWPDITAVRLDLPANGDDDAVAFRPDTAPGGGLGVGHLEMARRLAMAGMGAAVLPAYLVDADLVAGTLVRVAPIRPLAPVTLKLAHAHRASAGRCTGIHRIRRRRVPAGELAARLIAAAMPARQGSGLFFHGSSSTNERPQGATHA